MKWKGIKANKSFQQECSPSHDMRPWRPSFPCKTNNLKRVLRRVSVLFKKPTLLLKEECSPGHHMHRAASFGTLQVDRCFGFETAVEEAQRALLAAKVEAASAYKGIGLVKLMGRQSGFIAMQASMASGELGVQFDNVEPGRPSIGCVLCWTL
jgi:hypothetical protein